MSITLAIVAYVPIICNYQSDRLFCNNLQGVDIYSVLEDGTTQLLDSYDTPIDTRVHYEGNIIIVPRNTVA